MSGALTSVDVLANDVDSDGLGLTIESQTQPAHGATGCAGGSCLYTSEAGYIGPDSFTYTVRDATGDTDTATVAIDVVECAAAPGVCIDNGTIRLGINPQGHLNVQGGDPSLGGVSAVGLRYVPTNAEATAPGCLCEGWGAADATTGTTGYANES